MYVTKVKYATSFVYVRKKLNINQKDDIVMTQTSIIFMFSLKDIIQNVSAFICLEKTFISYFVERCTDIIPNVSMFSVYCGFQGEHQTMGERARKKVGERDLRKRNLYLRRKSLLNMSRTPTM